MAAGGPTLRARHTALGTILTTGRGFTEAGHPLYIFAGDTSPGATNGQGSDAFGARWDVLLPAGKEVSGG